MEILLAHVLLAALLFMIVNWIGRHSIASGYHQLTLFAKVDEAPAFNFVFRVLAPTVFLGAGIAQFFPNTGYRSDMTVRGALPAG